MIKFRGKKKNQTKVLEECRVAAECLKKKLDDLESERISREKREGNIESK